AGFYKGRFKAREVLVSSLRLSAAVLGAAVLFAATSAKADDWPTRPTPKRSALLPDVPSIVEAGYPDAVFRFWLGLSAPARTPPAIINKIHDAVEKALAHPALKDKLAHIGVQPE